MHHIVVLAPSFSQPTGNGKLLRYCYILCAHSYLFNTEYCTVLELKQVPPPTGSPLPLPCTPFQHCLHVAWSFSNPLHHPSFEFLSIIFYCSKVAQLLLMCCSPQRFRFHTNMYTSVCSATLTISNSRTTNFAFT